MPNKKFNVIKFTTYLITGLFLFSVWAGANYYNYISNAELAQVEKNVNVEMIVETVEDIEMEQMELRMEQRVALTPPPRPNAMVIPPMSRYDGSDEPTRSVAPSPPAPSPVVDELQERIDELEAEKAELLTEKKQIVLDIDDLYSIFKLDVGNPMINIVVLPLLLYVGRRILKILFDRLEAKIADAV
jgi:hypothetical protein